MCGVFGFVSTNGQRPSLKRLKALAVETERRGRHAFGFAWIDSHGRLRCYKQTGRISQSLDVLSIAADARLFIGHCRYATQGSFDNNLNNHPHPVDGGWLVHNGVIRRYGQLVAEHDLYPVSDCDSEVLGLLIEDFEGTMIARCAAAVREAAPDSPLVMMGLWKSPSRMIAVRSGNPLCMGEDERGFYLASLPKGLPAGAAEVPDESAISFHVRSGKLEVTRAALGSLVLA